MGVSRQQYQDEVKEFWSKKCSKLQVENRRLRDAINCALPSISSAMGNYEDARYIDIEVLYDALKDE